MSESGPPTHSPPPRLCAHCGADASPAAGGHTWASAPATTRAAPTLTMRRILGQLLNVKFLCSGCDREERQVIAREEAAAATAAAKQEREC